MKLLRHPIHLLCLLTLLVLSSCVPSGSGGSNKSSDETESSSGGTNSTPAPPEFNNSLNFYQDAGNSSSSDFIIPSDSLNTFYIRGAQIDSYIRNGNTSTTQCLVHHFPGSLNNKLAVWSALPRSFLNFNTGNLEYYYLVTPASKAENQTFCMKTGMITNLAASFAGASISFDASGVCPSCGPITLTADQSGLYSPSGFKIPNIDISYITFRMSMLPSSSNGPSITSCSTNNECIGKGFNCCSQGQCVNDRAIKSSTNTSSTEFIQSQVEIASNPNAIFNYPHLYHLCGTLVTATPTPTPNPVVTPTPTPEEQAQLDFEKKQEIFDCLNPVEGELAYCTKNIENFSTFTGTVETGADDRNFSTVYSGSQTIPAHSINKVTYGGEVLFENNTIVNSALTIGPSNSQVGNDTLTDTLVLAFNSTPQASAISDTFKIRYKVDGSCVKVNSAKAQCYKEYVQGQNTGLVTDHFPASNKFIIPFYADLTLQVITEVDDVRIPMGSAWQTGQDSNKYIEFSGSSLAVLDTQKVKITFFVDLASNNVLQAKQDAINDVKSICGCSSDDCTLKEVIDPITSKVVNYSCDYPDPDVPPPPQSQTVYLSAKSVAQRYFDNTGAPQYEVTALTTEVEGTKFEYTDGNHFKPNNVSADIGFSEINGTLGFASSHAFPAKKVDVKANETYDIYTYTGSFSSCLNCGNDYYSLVAKLFPSSFSNPGGGYEPNISASNRQVKSSEIRADDMVFGRACWVPATMLPWAHMENSDRQSQRQRRQDTQHFLFANGYQRDWYGFDYGSVIGSFDGISWFSIGSRRRIKAKSNKLYLAVNGYFGDLTTDSTFTIHLSEMSVDPNNGAGILTDFESDGAQCQQQHICTKDSDCAARLGWDYVCESVSGVKSTWPEFDINSLEKPLSTKQVNLLNLTASSSGSTKRCVYRGRGAPCSTNYNAVTETNSYNSRTETRFHGCAPGYYCQEFFNGGNTVDKFNTKIARFARSVANQNASSSVTESDLDTFGKGARTIGRPFSFIGDQSVPTQILGNLNNNNIDGLCIPGKNPEDDSFLNQMSKAPELDHAADHVTGIGMTPVGSTASSEYLSSCGVFNASGDYVAFESPSTALSNKAGVRDFAGAQIIPTNALTIFEGTNIDLIENFLSGQITEKTLEENRCLRAPGTTCHTSLDCAASKYITDKIGSISTSSVNSFELKFWQEELICSQATKPTDPSYDLSNNKCCRDVGKTITIGLDTDQNSALLDTESIPGMETNLDSFNRYSRATTLHYKRETDGTNFPRLLKAADDACGGVGCLNTSNLARQYNSINEIATKTCCTNNWVRNFHTNNGGGHNWGPGKFQVFDKTNFRCVNWQLGGNNFDCGSFTDPDDTGCMIRSISTGEAKVIFDWLSKIELSGIPQVAVESGKSLTNTPSLECKVNPDDQSIAGTNTIIPGMVQTTTTAEYTDGTDEFFSASDVTNFESDKKLVFSDTEFSCCLPLGSKTEDGDDPSICCSGNINPTNKQCALKNYSDISMYFNRFVSSEANGLDKSLFDTETGYIKNASVVQQLACQKQACASGLLAFGVAHSDLRVPGHENNAQFTTRRFIDDNSDQQGLHQFFDEGLKWNTHLYCLPEEFAGTESDALTIIDCLGGN